MCDDVYVREIYGNGDMKIEANLLAHLLVTTLNIVIWKFKFCHKLYACHITYLIPVHSMPFCQMCLH